MRKLIIAAAALLCAATITPAVAKDKTADQTPEQRCAMEGMWAYLLMGFRQLGTPPSDLIHKHPDQRAMIMMAYDYPRYNTEEMRDRAKEDFRVDVEKMCFEALRGL